jgi:hypothetical protein
MMRLGIYACQRVALGLALLALVLPLPAADRTPVRTGPGYVWWEGEDAVEKNFEPESVELGWMHQGRAKEALSGGSWLVMRGRTPEGGWHALWRITVPKTAEYDFWMRLGYGPWVGNDWRVDGGKWRQRSHNHSYHQMVQLAQYRPTSWVLLDRMKLTRGTHTFEIRIQGVSELVQAFDCFALSEGPFTPRGKLRPDEQMETTPARKGAENWWAFQATAPEGKKRSVDLTFMNDPVGSHGALKMREGELFFEDDTSVRFWGVNCNFWGGRMVYPSHATADRLSEHLARIGVNCVRLHVLHSANSLIDDTRDDTQHFDLERLDKLDYLAAALKKKGIYLSLDLVYHRMFKAGDMIDDELVGSEPDEDYNVNWAAGSAAMFHPRAIELNRALYRKFLEHRNPYTGSRWVDSAQLAILTIQNEQSLFWGTTNVHRGKVRELLDRLYTDWLKRKYGGQGKLGKAWQVDGEESPFEPGEDLALGLIHLGPVGAQSEPCLRKRDHDQLRFLYDIETRFYRETIQAMRNWGVRCPIVTSNWQGAAQTSRLVLQASAMGDIVDRHHYFDRPESMLKEVGRGIPIAAFEQVAERAFSLSEWNGGEDGSYVSEVVPLVATIAAFQGWDAMFQFAQSSPTWEPYLRGGIVTAPHSALYPIAAMIFRRGDIRPGEVIYERRRDPDAQFSLEPEQQSAAPQLIALGRVQNRYVERRQKDRLRKEMVERLWDRDAQVCRANTGQFEWSYGEGWLRLNAERTQGAFGAIGDRKIACRDVSFETPNEFCTLIATSMEKKPISRAGRILVVALGRATNQLAAPGATEEVPPCLLEPVTGTVSIRTKTTRVHAVSIDGFRLHEVPSARLNGTLTFRMEGEPRVVYYELTGG